MAVAAEESSVIQVHHLDHLVLTVQDIETTCQFYARALGMEVITFQETRRALVFGRQKINLHQHGYEFEPKAAHPTPGSADLCFLTTTPLDAVISHLTRCGIPLIEGPVRRTGTRYTLRSVYFRDPDGNLIEVSNELEGATEV